MSSVLSIDKHDFAPSGFTHSGTWVVDFSATWCPPCRAMAPVMASLAAELAGTVGIAHLTSDDEPALTDRYGIQSFPTYMVFRDGQPIARRVGSTSIVRMRAWIEDATRTH